MNEAPSDTMDSPSGTVDIPGTRTMNFNSPSRTRHGTDYSPQTSPETTPVKHSSSLAKSSSPAKQEESGEDLDSASLMAFLPTASGFLPETAAKVLSVTSPQALWYIGQKLCENASTDADIAKHIQSITDLQTLRELAGNVGAMSEGSSEDIRTTLLTALKIFHNIKDPQAMPSNLVYTESEPTARPQTPAAQKSLETMQANARVTLAFSGADTSLHAKATATSPLYAIPLT
jgi:hypothetical protein